MSLSVPESLLTPDELARITLFERELADSLDAALANGGGAISDAIDVTSYAALADDETDNRAYVQAALEAAYEEGKNLFFPGPGTYYISGYLDVDGHQGTRIYGGPGARIRFNSDDEALVIDGIALSNLQARSAFLARNTTDVSITDLAFVGGDDPDFIATNMGCLVSGRKNVGLKVLRCSLYGGYSLCSQDANTGTTGTGDSMTVSDGIVTLTDAAAPFSRGHTRREISVSGASNYGNNGTFVITEYVSTSVIKYANPNAVAETSSFRWQIDDHDRNTIIQHNRSTSNRGSIITGIDSLVSNNLFEKPMLLDVCGVGDTLAISGSTVTLTDKSARFLPMHHGKVINIQGSTSPANDGLFILTYISATQVSWTNASGVSEAYDGDWWISNGERSGLGAASTTISMSGSTATYTALVPSFNDDDVGKLIRVNWCSNVGNQGAFAIEEVVSPTQIRYTNASGVNESFQSIWTIDAWLRANGGVGSTHAIYYFAGRSGIVVENNIFRGIRATCVKWSGSSLPNRQFIVRNNVAYECGDFFVGGADDAQEHTNLLIEGNVLLDCATGNIGHGNSVAIQVLGSRNVSVLNNKLHYTRNTIGALDGRGIAGNFGIQVAPGVQPNEDADIRGNTFTIDPVNCTHQKILQTGVDCRWVGIMAKWNTAGTLTKSGNTMTLTDSGNQFTSQDVGRTVRFALCTSGGNNGYFTITSVPTSTSFTFENASGVAEASGGTYGLYGFTGDGGGLRIAHNRCLSAAQTAINTTSCVGPDISENTVANGGIYCQGDVTPRVHHNREVAATTQNARVQVFDGASWPIIHDNATTYSAIGGSSAWDMGVGNGGGQPVDYPLCGVKGRCAPSEGCPEVVFAWGSLHVDGDRFIIGASTFTYKTTAPGANQFNDMAGLIALIGAIGGGTYLVDDYGADFSPSMVTEHVRIRLATTSTTADLFTVQTETLNPTALVVLRNSSVAHDVCHSRGEQDGGGDNDKSVVWSPVAAWTSCVNFVADNADAQTLLATDGYRIDKNGGLDAGCNETVIHGDAAGTERFRWGIR